MGAEEFWLAPIGLLMDLCACHRQFLGQERPRREHFIDEVFVDGI